MLSLRPQTWHSMLHPSNMHPQGYKKFSNTPGYLIWSIALVWTIEYQSFLKKSVTLIKFKLCTLNSSYSEPINTAVFHRCCTINLIRYTSILYFTNIFVWYILGLKSRISKKIVEGLGRKPDFKLFHYKARVQPVSKITTIATRNRRWI